MLHRMAMRVAPALTLAVTEADFRRRKRVVMAVPGLVAFALYRGLKAAAWHEDIIVLLCASGLFSSLVALAAYAYGRERPFVDVLREDGLRTQAWVALRIGFLYAVQLSLMVLALLKVATYDYQNHPDGPAMMALVIPRCRSRVMRLRSGTCACCNSKADPLSLCRTPRRCGRCSPAVRISGRCGLPPRPWRSVLCIS